MIENQPIRPTVPAAACWMPSGRLGGRISSIIPTPTTYPLARSCRRSLVRPEDPASPAAACPGAGWVGPAHCGLWCVRPRGPVRSASGSAAALGSAGSRWRGGLDPPSPACNTQPAGARSTSVLGRAAAELPNRAFGGCISRHRWRQLGELKHLNSSRVSNRYSVGTRGAHAVRGVRRPAATLPTVAAPRSRQGGVRHPRWLMVLGLAHGDRPCTPHTPTPRRR